MPSNPIVRQSPVIVYRLFNSKGTLLYAGMSTRGFQRINEHLHHTSWWADVATVQITHHSSRQAALDTESDVILQELPHHNVTGQKKAETEFWKVDSKDIRDVLLNILETIPVRPKDTWQLVDLRGPRAVVAS